MTTSIQTLMACCEHGDVGTLDRLFQETHVLTQRHHFIYPRYIEVAVRHGHLPIVKRLIEYPHIFQQSDCAAIALAICSNRVDIAQLLIECNWPNRFDLIQLAVQYAHPDTLEWLIQQGIRSNNNPLLFNNTHPNTHPNTPLHNNTQPHSIDMIHLLMRDGYPGTPKSARFAIHQGDTELFHLIFPTLTPEEQTHLKLTLQHHNEWEYLSSTSE